MAEEEKPKNPEEERIVWVRESGQDIVTNSHPATIKKAEKLGWKRKKK